jgi:hypothetical protein
MQRSSISSLSLSPDRTSSVAATTMAADDCSGLWRGREGKAAGSVGWLVRYGSFIGFAAVVG